jgi:putative NIF3 family GTP cyclohydrolase 1 type 2
MPYINVHVDLDDIYDDMDRRDKQNMAEWLYDDGILGTHSNQEIRTLVRGKEESSSEVELRDNLLKLWNAHYQLSNEEEEMIKKIASKF